MSTLPSTKEEFYKDLSKFIEITGVKTTPVETVKGAMKCVNLRYLGLTATKDEIESAAMMLQVATQGAIVRGWDI